MEIVGKAVSTPGGDRLEKASPSQSQRYAFGRSLVTFEDKLV